MTDLKHKLPVAPLSDARWRTIEEKLFEQLDCEPVSMPAVLTPGDVRPRRSRRTLAVFAFATAATAAALLLLGVVLRDVGRGDPTARIATDESASHLAFGDADIDVAPNSVVLLRGDAATGVLAVIERGKARFSVAPRQDRPPFAVSAGEVRVEVVGTVFSVTRQGDLATVAVTEGKVRVRHRGELALVTDGEVWAPGADLSAEAAPADIEEADGDGDNSGDARARRRSRRANGEAASDNARSSDGRGRNNGRDRNDGRDRDDDRARGERASDGEARNNGEKRSDDPLFDLDSAERDEDSNWLAHAPDDSDDDFDAADFAEPDAARRSNRRAAKTAKRNRAKQARRERAKRSANNKKPEIDLPPPVDRSASESASERYMRAAELEASSPKKALALYRELAGENNEWSEVAMFAWGRLELERGKQAAARRVLERYLSRYPRGRNRADARALLNGADD